MKRRLLLVTLLAMFSSLLKAQPNEGGDSDFETLSFGFMFQYFNSDFKIYKHPNWRAPYSDPQTGLQVTDSVSAIRSLHKPGFGLGFVTNLRMGDHADLRFTPGLAFTDKEVLYYYRSPTPVAKTVQSTTVDLPVGIKLKSDQRANFRVYLIAGMKYSVNIVSKKKTDDAAKAPLDKLLKMNEQALNYEAGIGFDFYFPYFKMSPELKMSQSTGNVMKRDRGPYSFPIDKLFLHSLQLSLYFQ